jgi:acetyltransferase-like isoleucine patch superfamily enzyme
VILSSLDNGSLDTSAPDRRLPSGLVPLRAVVRRMRVAALRLRATSSLEIGENVRFGARSVLNAPDFVRLGDNIRIGRDFHLETNLTVANDVLISSRVAIVGNDHPFDAAAATVFSQGRAPASHVVLGGDNLIGFGVTIVGSVSIGRGCIVGAGAVVASDLPPFTVCVGVPARAIRERYPDAAHIRAPDGPVGR